VEWTIRRQEKHESRRCKPSVINAPDLNKVNNSKKHQLISLPASQRIRYVESVAQNMPQCRPFRSEGNRSVDPLLKTVLERHPLRSNIQVSWWQRQHERCNAQLIEASNGQSQSANETELYLCCAFAES